MTTNSSELSRQETQDEAPISGADNVEALDFIDTQTSNVANIEYVPPDGGYGWVCTISIFLINAHTWGINAVRQTLP